MLRRLTTPRLLFSNWTHETFRLLENSAASYFSKRICEVKELVGFADVILILVRGGSAKLLASQVLNLAALYFTALTELETGRCWFGWCGRECG